ncbi:MAG: hypothetical protein LBO74_03420, partial [Candidatus Symbiothrix sp.]|nr:hypothetical protein [Candidatus Symbiothrix sp.]
MYKVKFIILLFVITVFGSMSQVGIQTNNPNPNSVFEVVSPDSTKGVMIPRMTEAQRNAISVVHVRDNSLMIYNIDEDCYNYYSKTESEWKSVCGSLGKSVIELPNGCSDIEVFGAYVQNNSLETSHFLRINVNVIKAGSYVIIGQTTNGYGFSASGTFLATGTQTVMVFGQGKPQNANASPGDLLTLTLNGVDSGCNSIRIIVAPPTAEYSMTCGSITPHGAYLKGVALGAGNTITLRVEVTDISTGGSWAITSNTVDGISFRGSGNFTSTGDNTVTLYGYGTPTSREPKILTFTSNSRSGSATCQGTVIMAIAQKRIACVTTYANTCGYNWATPTSTLSHQMLTAQGNYGQQNNSVIKFEGFTFENLNGVSDANLINLFNRTTNIPDIVVTGYAWTSTNDAVADAMLKYMAKGGVVILYAEAPSTVARLMNTIMGTNGSITTRSINAAGALYHLASKPGDPIIDGPFGYIGDLYIGEDASSTVGISNLPSGEITVYAYGQDFSSVATSPAGATT